MQKIRIEKNFCFLKINKFMEYFFMSMGISRVTGRFEGIYQGLGNFSDPRFYEFLEKDDKFSLA